MLDQVIDKLEDNRAGETVNAGVILDCINMLDGEDDYPAQKAKQLLSEQIGLPQGKAPSELTARSAEQEVPAEFILGALRALFESQDE